MKIKNLTASGIKGGPIDLTLQDVTLITGPNFSGKTSRLDAIRLALLGYVPSFGKRDTMSLSTGERMDVTARFDNGDTVTRSFGKGGKAGEPLCPPVLLDCGEYFGLGDKDRVRYVFASAKIEDAEGAREKLTVKIRSLRPSEGIEADTFQSGLEVFLSECLTGHTNTQELIETAIKTAREKHREGKASLDRAKKTVEGLVTLELSREDVATYDHSETITSARSDIESLVRRQGTLQAKVTELRRAESRRDNLRMESGEIPTCSVSLASIEELRDRVNCYESQLGIAQINLERTRRDFDGFVNALKGLVNQQISGKAARVAIEEAECCPTCKAAGTGWRDAVLAIHDRQATELAQQISGQHDIISAQKRLIASREKELDIAQTADSEHRQELANLRRIEAEFANHQRLLARRAQESAELTTLEQRDIEGELELSQQATADLLTELEAKRTLLTRLQEAQRAHEAIKQDAQRLAQARLQERELTGYVDAYRQGLDVLETYQRDLVARAFGGLLETVNRLTHGILRRPVQYHDGEIGWFDGGHWIGHKTFSGFEQALIYAGLSVALASTSPIKIILMDELGIVHPSLKGTLMARLAGLVQHGTIDQAVMVDVTADHYPTDIGHRVALSVK